MNPPGEHPVSGSYRDGQVILDGEVPWPAGTRVAVSPILPLEPCGDLAGHVIVVGFGLAGRFVADLLEHAKVRYTIVEKNAVTVGTQRALGRRIIEGSAADVETLVQAGINDAAILALTMPDEAAVLSAVTLARRLRPNIYIIARTNYSSQGMRASQLGADDVIKAEQAVAFQFYDKLSRRLRRPATNPA